MASGIPEREAAASGRSEMKSKRVWFQQRPVERASEWKALWSALPTSSVFVNASAVEKPINGATSKEGMAVRQAPTSVVQNVISALVEDPAELRRAAAAASNAAVFPGSDVVDVVGALPASEAGQVAVQLDAEKLLKQAEEQVGDQFQGLLDSKGLNRLVTSFHRKASRMGCSCSYGSAKPVNLSRHRVTFCCSTKKIWRCARDTQMNLTNLWSLNLILTRKLRSSWPLLGLLSCILTLCAPALWKLF